MSENSIIKDKNKKVVLDTGMPVDYKKDKNKKDKNKKDKNKKDKNKKDDLDTGMPVDYKNNINVINSLKENYLSWIVMFISGIILSYPDITSGIITVIFCYVSYYLLHCFQHYCDLNIFNIIHNYHHDHSHTLLSTITEILLELNFLNTLLPYLYIFNIQIINTWIIILYTFMYITIHNINYTILRVNKVHNLHHRYVKTNYGPDVCDILFGTKNNLESTVENTDHYIPNIIIGLIIVYFIQSLYLSSETWKFYLKNIGLAILAISFILYSAFSIYLWFFVKDKYEIKERLRLNNSSYV